MSAAIPQINRRECDALYRALMADLPHVVDVVLAIGRSEYALAQMLRTRYEAELRLLDDLGWTPTAPGLERFDLMSPPRRLAHALHRLGRVSVGRLVDYYEVHEAPTDPTTRAHLEDDALVVDVCDRLLAQLAGPSLAVAAEPRLRK